MFAMTRFCWSRFFFSILILQLLGQRILFLMLRISLWYRFIKSRFHYATKCTWMFYTKIILVPELYCPCISESKKTWQLWWKDDKIWGHWCWLEQGICLTKKYNVGTSTQRVLVYWQGKLNLGVKETCENETRKKIIKWGTSEWWNLSITGFVKVQLLITVFSTN